MNQEWWYACNDEKLGPFPLPELLQCLGDDQINLDTLVWQPEWKEWRKLMDVEEIRTQVLEVLREQRRRIPPPLPPSNGVEQFKHINKPVHPKVAGNSTSLGNHIFGVLRLIRGLCGFMFAMQIVGLLPILTWLQQPAQATGGMWVQALFKVIAMILFGWLFFWLRSLINRFYTKRHGVPHPVLAEKKWAL